MAIWVNSDGLTVNLGPTEATPGVAGEFPVVGVHNVVEVMLSLTSLNTSTDTILDNNVWLPKNARIEEVEVEVLTAATSGGSATLDVGLVRYDRTTAIDSDGLVAAAALATLTPAGKRLTLINGATAAGALIGTTTANPGYFVAKAGTAVFTAGLLAVRTKFVFL